MNLLTDRQLEILQHALGADEYGRWPGLASKGIPSPPRNYFSAGAPITRASIRVAMKDAEMQKGAEE